MAVKASKQPNAVHLEPGRLENETVGHFLNITTPDRQPRINEQRRESSTEKNVGQ